MRKRKTEIVPRKANSPPDAPGYDDRAEDGFYSGVLDEAEKLDFEEAAGVDGIDEEIALLRCKIKSILEEDPENVRLLIDATDTLANLVKMRYHMSRKQEKNLGEAIKNIIRDICVPLGIAVINKKL